jgi:hypothetical protein
MVCSHDDPMMCMDGSGRAEVPVTDVANTTAAHRTWSSSKVGATPVVMNVNRTSLPVALLAYLLTYFAALHCHTMCYQPSCMYTPGCCCNQAHRKWRHLIHRLVMEGAAATRQVPAGCWAASHLGQQVRANHDQTTEANCIAGWHGCCAACNMLTMNEHYPHTASISLWRIQLPHTALDEAAGGW